jgi:hypothetical protein
MLPVSLGCVVFLFCFSSSCVLYVASYQKKQATKKTKDEEKQNKNTTQPKETGNIEYTR